MFKRRNDDVPLREHLEALRNEDVNRESFDVQRGRERVAWLTAIGLLAWSEIQRRLEVLNHENARLLKQQESSVSADTYKANETQRVKEAADFATWRQKVDLEQSRSISREEFQRDSRRDSRETFGVVSNGVRTLVAVALAVAALIGYEIAHASRPITTTTVTQTVTTAPTLTTP